MIKETELKLGNWVWCGYNGTKAKVEALIPQQSVLGFGNMAYGVKVHTAKVIIDFDLIEPIALTPELLEKCNCTNIENERWHTPNLLPFTFDGLAVNITIGNKWCHFSYLHKFQNIIALTGEELQIDL